jgi:uncharacterized protein YbbK (DUF523 family)/uncharacterized protein YbgA (DUF1722 family)
MALKRSKQEMPVRVGVSSCLLGMKVRYDGGHKRDCYITDVLGKYVEFVSVCPEWEIGMGVPREAVNLTGTPEAPAMIGEKTGADRTRQMNNYSDRRVRKRDIKRLSGYILKKDSPSCGMKRVRLFTNNGSLSRKGVGLFAKKLMERYPLLPVEEEYRLQDVRIREDFIERVFAYHNLQKLFIGRFNRRKAAEFHTANKCLIRAHSPRHYKLMEQFAADTRKYSPAEFRSRYCEIFMEALEVKRTTRKNVAILRHIYNSTRDRLSADEKRYILDNIEDYRKGFLPLIVPIALLRYCVEKYKIEHLTRQTYLNPNSRELILRNHA